jgi:chromosomal replication initiation ATPase DnaA
MLPRAEVYKRLLDLGWSYSAIGKACGRDHSTIMYYVRRWSDKHDKA